VPPATPIPLVGGAVIPLQAPLGEQFLCAQVDPGNVVPESNETNNVRCLKVQVISPPI
jgi:hypothetical protein